ncbi:MAG: efflux RND transporter periplasmic adaptor subunit [Bacteroidota bacterium]
MKKMIIMFIAVTFLVSCGSGDKKAKLDKLKKQKSEIELEIKTLEAEVLGSDSTKKNTNIVSVTELIPTEFNHYVELQGRVDGEDNVIATSKGAGVITAIFVKEGQSVKKGQVLAELDMQVLNQTMSELKAQLDFATNLYNKQKNLWDQKIGSEVQYLSAKNQKESLENKMATFSDQIDLMRIKSPINGTIEEIPVKIGQSIAPGMIAFRVVNFSKVKVLVDVSETYASKVRTGDEAIVSFPDFNEEIATKVSFASRYINPSNRSFQVEIRLNPGKMEFRANMIAVVKINDYVAKNSVVVPVNVVQKGLSDDFVLVAVKKGSTTVAEKRKITLGLTYGGNAEVKSGLKHGEKILVSGFQNVNDGDLITVQ